MGIFKLKRKLYTVYDETDQLKRMKDADILAEDEKKTRMFPAIAKTAAGAGTGAVAGSIIGLISGLLSKKGAMKGMAHGATMGGIIGGGITGVPAFKKVSEEKEENSNYNRRLAYAKKYARRREKEDWKRNMTTRDGYSY